MALQLHVPKTSIGPDGWLQGSVILPPTNSDGEISPQVVVVSLLGISKTRVVIGNGTNQEVQESCITFLRIDTKLCNDMGRQSSGRFQILLPQDPAFAQHDYSDLPDPRYPDRPGPQTLPPSGDFGSGNTITYTVEASLVGGGPMTQAKACKVLEFTKLRAFERSDPQILATDRFLYLKSISSAQRPVYLHFSLDSPQIVIQGQAFPVLLRRSSEGFTSADLCLRSCIIQLMVNTSINSSDGYQSHWTSRHTIGRFEVGPQTASENLPVITPEGLDLGMVIRDLKSPLHYAPTFQSPNIERSYGLIIQLVVQCGGDSNKFAYVTCSVTVLACQSAAAERQRKMEIWQMEHMRDFPEAHWPDGRLVE